MNFRFTLDLAFFIASMMFVTMGSRFAVIKVSRFVEKQTLSRVHKGLPSV